jgi:hypothetical protein
MKDSLIAPQTKEFVKLCRKYFEYIEILPDRKISDFWAVQLQLLPQIYSGVLQLPDIKERYSYDIDKFVTEDMYNDAFANLIAFINENDRYSDFDSLSNTSDVKIVNASLSETFTDIYQELKDFVLLYESGTIENINDSIAECVITFKRYWGIKLLSATRIIHAILYQKRTSALVDTLKYNNVEGEDDTEYENYDDDDDDGDNQPDTEEELELDLESDLLFDGMIENDKW